MPETHLMSPLERLDLEQRATRMERRQNWQLVAVGGPVMAAMIATAVGYGTLVGHVDALDDAVLALASVHKESVLTLSATDKQQWESIQRIGPILLKVAADVAYLRGLQAAPSSSPEDGRYGEK